MNEKRITSILESEIYLNIDEKFRIMADCSPVMLWMAGNDARCTFFNQTWLAFTGKSMDQEIGYGWAEGVHHEDFQRCMDIYLNAFKARQEFSMEYRLQRNDGEYRWLLDSGRPYWDNEKKFQGFIGSCIDITGLKQAREREVEQARLETRLAEREQASQKLEEANKELEAFSYSVSHDLRAPLRAITGFARALTEELGEGISDKSAKYLRLVSENAHEMGHLIEDLLRFSRVGQQSLQRKKVDLYKVVKSVLQDLRHKYEGRSMEIQLEYLYEEYVDPILIKQVFMNLIENAIKYTRKCKMSKIHIGSKEKHGERIYFVSDNGEGFDMNYADKLFGVFQRLHRQEEFEGTGVGLAIVRRIIERHGGHIKAEAYVGQGAHFYFTLPVCPDFLSEEGVRA